MTTYSISLDDVDLAFLPLRTHKYNDFLKKEHFQFQVMKKDNVEEPVSTVFYTCHVCAIEVPAAFASEHVASIKHRASARIASVAMQRTHKLISILPPPSGTIHPPSGRFCTNCAIVADDDHDKTKDHRVAAIHDNLLWDLMKAYVGELEYEELKDDYKDNINSEDQGPEHHKNIDSGFDNDGKDATVVSIVNKDPQTSLPEINHNNDRIEEKDRSKAVDHSTNIFINDDGKNSNSTADAVLAQETIKKQKSKKIKRQPPIHETIVSSCEIVSNKNLQKLNKDEDFTKLETRKTNDTITKRTEWNIGNNNILDSSKHQNVIKIIRDPDGLTQLNRIATEERSSRHDNKNEVTQSTNHSIMPTNSRVNQAETALYSDFALLTQGSSTPQEFYEKCQGIFSTIMTYVTLHETVSTTISTKRDLYQKLTLQAYLRGLKDPLGSKIRCMRPNSMEKALQFVQEELNTMYMQQLNEDARMEWQRHSLQPRMSLPPNSLAPKPTPFGVPVAQPILNMPGPSRPHPVQSQPFQGWNSIFPPQMQLMRAPPQHYNPQSNVFRMPNRFPQSQPQKTEIKNPYEERFGELWCLVCECRVPTDMRNRKEHVKGSRHLNNMK